MKQNMQEDSRQVIGRFLGPDRKRSGEDLIHTNRTENGTMSLRSWWSTSVKADIPCFRGSRALERGRFEEQRWRNIVNTIQWQRRNRRSVFSHNHFRQSAQYLRSSSGYVWRASLRNLQMFRGYGETRSTERFGDHGNANRIVDNKWNPSDRWESTGRPVVRLWATKVRKSSSSS